MIWELFKTVFNTLVDLVRNIFEFIKNLPSLIWEIFKTAFETVIETLKNIWDFFFNFFENLLNFLKEIFIPEEGYFTNNFNNLKEIFLSKFKFIEQIDSVFNSIQSRTYSVEDLSIKFPKYNLEIDFSWYEPYRLKFKNALMGFFALIFVAGIVKRNDPNINMGG